MRHAASHSRSVRRTTSPRTPSACCLRLGVRASPMPSSSKITTETGWSGRAGRGDPLLHDHLEEAARRADRTPGRRVLAASVTRRAAGRAPLRRRRAGSPPRRRSRRARELAAQACGSRRSASCELVLRCGASAAPSAAPAIAASTPETPATTASSGGLGGDAARRRPRARRSRPRCERRRVAGSITGILIGRGRWRRA